LPCAMSEEIAAKYVDRIQDEVSPHCSFTKN